MFRYKNLSLFLLFCIAVTQSACGNPKPTPKTKNDMVVPIANGIYWGLATPDMKVVVPCQFTEVRPMGRYIAMQKDTFGHGWYLYTKTGKFVANASMLTLNVDGPVLLIDFPDDSETDTTGFNFTYGENNTYQIWDGIYISANARLVDPVTDSIIQLKGKLISAVSQFKDAKLVLKEGDKLGVYDVNMRKYILPVKFKKIESIPFAVFKTTDEAGIVRYFSIKGEELEIKGIANGGVIDTTRQIVKASGKQISYGDKETLWLRQDNFQIDNTAELIRRPNPKPNSYNIFDLVDGSGNLLISEIYLAEELASDLYLITRASSPGTSDGKTFGIYDVRQRKYVFPYEDGQQYDRKGKLMKIVRGDSVSYYTLRGKFLERSIWLSPREDLKEINLPNTVIRGYAHDYYAILSSKDSLYHIYDEGGNLLYDDIYNVNYSNDYATVTYKRNGKWGLWNNYLQEILPAEYDEPISTREGVWDRVIHFTQPVVQDGKHFFVDVKTKKPLFDKKDYGAVSDRPVNGKRLAMTFDAGFETRSSYKQKVRTLDIINEDGKSLYSWEPGDDFGKMNYILMHDGRVFCYTGDNFSKPSNIYIYDPASGKKKSFDKEGEIGMCAYDGIPLLLSKKEGTEYILYDARTFKEVCRTKIFCAAYPLSIDESDPAYQGIMLQENQQDDPVSGIHAFNLPANTPEPKKIGFYNLEGKFFKLK